jgi:S-DNA-T family DNA segregation ATPase FtsK/SpoIIIE
MAYQTRQRDPFLDRETHAILVRRGQELLGLVLLGLGVALAALMLSYTPDDPNWMAATDTAPQNLLGRTGASVAAILMMIVGYGALVLPVASIVWGTRLSCMRGRTVPCRACSSCRSSLRWRRSTRPATCRRQDGRIPSVLGGLFGDTVLGAVLNALPLAARRVEADRRGGVPRRCAMLMHVAGISPGSSGRRCGSSSTACWTGAMIVAAGCAGSAPASGGRGNRSRPRGSRGGRPGPRTISWSFTRTTGDCRIYETGGRRRNPRSCAATGLPEPHAASAVPPRPRTIYYPADALQPELPQRPGAILDDDIEAPDDDRVRARISDAIRSRVRRPNPVTAATQARLASGDAARADRLHLSPALRMEPPLTASQLDDADMSTTSLPRTGSAPEFPNTRRPKDRRTRR